MHTSWLEGGVLAYDVSVDVDMKTWFIYIDIYIYKVPILWSNNFSLELDALWEHIATGVIGLNEHSLLLHNSRRTFDHCCE